MRNTGYAKSVQYDFLNSKRKNGQQMTLESFHTNLILKFISHGPNFWDFINKLNEIILSPEKDMERINNGLPIGRNSIKPSTLQRNLILEILKADWGNNAFKLCKSLIS